MRASFLREVLKNSNALVAGRRFGSSAAEEIIDIKDPRHPQHPANWDPTFPKAGPPLPQAWSEDPRNFGRMHPVLRSWVAVLAAGILWTTALHFFATNVRTDPAEHWKARQGAGGEAKEGPKPGIGAASPLDIRRDKAAAARELLQERTAAPGSSAPSPSRTQTLEHWLRSRGVQLGCLTVTDTLAPSSSPSSSGDSQGAPWASGRGLGLAVGTSGRPLGSFGGGIFRSGAKILARIPLDAALTAENLIAQQPYGEVLHDAVAANLADARTVIILGLLVEKLRGDASPLAPYVSALPESFTTPLSLPEADLRHLRGTPLYDATATLRDRLRQQWTKLRPFAIKALAAAGPSTEPPTFDDFLWAYNAFWSRGHQLPTGEDALIPGLDFCNHSLEPNARWEFVPGKAGVYEDHILLVSAGKSVPPVDSEVTISYGDKSDEELLFLHGFALGRNPFNRLMVHMDATALALREESLVDRRELMAREGGAPFLYLPSPDTLDTPFPARALRCAEILTLPAPELNRALTAARSGAPSDPSTFELDDPSAWKEFKRRPLSEQMAILSVLRGLLEQTVDSLEDATRGSGSLEADVALLQRGGLSGGVLPCVLYRAGLKRMAREWLVRAKTELAEVVQGMQEAAGGE